MKRLFVAINIPKKTRKKLFEKAFKELPGKTAKIAKEENLHITMAFLGSVEEKGIPEIVESLCFAERMPEFSIEISGFGCFGNRVIWAGIGKGSKELLALREKLENSLELRDKRFHPHITLARNKRQNGKKISRIANRMNEGFFSEKFRAKSLDLMESVLSPSGASYSPVKKISFFWRKQ